MPAHDRRCGYHACAPRISHGRCQVSKASPVSSQCFRAYSYVMILSFLTAFRLPIHVWTMHWEEAGTECLGGTPEIGSPHSRRKIDNVLSLVRALQTCDYCRPQPSRYALSPSFLLGSCSSARWLDRLTTKALGVVGWVHELVREADETSASNNRTLAPYSSAFPLSKPLLGLALARPLTSFQVVRYLLG